jgi:septal ring factor EnvC (AmiA/AmiB activator)
MRRPPHSGPPMKLPAPSLFLLLALVVAAVPALAVATPPAPADAAAPAPTAAEDAAMDDRALRAEIARLRADNVRLKKEQAELARQIAVTKSRIAALTAANEEAAETLGKPD